MSDIPKSQARKYWMLFVASVILIAIISHELRAKYHDDNLNLGRTEVIEEYVRRRGEGGDSERG